MAVVLGVERVRLAGGETSQDEVDDEEDELGGKGEPQGHGRADQERHGAGAQDGVGQLLGRVAQADQSRDRGGSRHGAQQCAQSEPDTAGFLRMAPTETSQVCGETKAQEDQHGSLQRRRYDGGHPG